MQKGSSIASLDKAISQLIQSNAPDGIKQNLKIHAVPITDYYLQKDNAVVKRMLFALSFVGFFILLMAVVNFINIAISSSGNRMKEIGVRKVLDGLRSQLVFQFLTESFILVLIATALALAVYPFASPVYSEMVGKSVPSLLSFPLHSHQLFRMPAANKSSLPMGHWSIAC